MSSSCTASPPLRIDLTTTEGNSGSKTSNLLSILGVDIGENVVVSLSQMLAIWAPLSSPAAAKTEEFVLVESPLANQHPWSTSTLLSPVGTPDPHS